MAGRPQPAKLKLLKGVAPGKDTAGRPINVGPAFRRDPLGPPPPELNDKAAEVWNRIVPELERLELTKPLDRDSIAAYCLIVGRLYEAQEDVDENGIIVQGAKGRVKNPAVGVVEEATRSLRMWAIEFGFTPASESRLHSPPAEDSDEGNPFAEGADSASG